MKKLTAFALAAIVTSVFADKATFPYGVNMTPRISTNETVTVADSEAELTGTKTPATDTVAELNLSAVTFTAIDADSWNEFVADYDGSAAMLAIKADGANTNWFGYSGTTWVELDGPDIDLSATYDVKIGFDKTAGNKIRYSVKANEGTWTDLNTNGVAWIAQGGTLTQLSKVVLKGTGSAESGALGSGVRGAYANIGEIVEKYSFDYSNIVFTVKVNEGTYGDKLKITVGDKSIEQDFVVGNNTVDFTNRGLIPGSTYDCKIEIVKDGTDPDVRRNSPVNLAATADWFGFTNGVFVKAAGDSNVEIVDNNIVAKDDSLPAVITPSSESAANAKSTVEITVDYTEAFAETTVYGNAQSALALTSEGWKCLAGGSWTAITNDNVSTAAGEYATRAEFDYTANPGKVRFSVKQGSGEWYVMSAVDGGATWFTLAGSATKLAGTSFVGSGKVSAIAANYTTTEGIPPTIVGNTIGLVGSTDLKLADIAADTYTIEQQIARKYSMKWTDSADKHATINADGQLVVSSGAAANGIDSYDSYVLGLDPENAASKPVLDSAQNSKTGALDVKVANVVANTNVAEVAMKVVATDTPAGDTGTEYVFENGTATIPLPAGVKYYKVKISIKTK